MLGALLQRWSFNGFRAARKGALQAGDMRIAYVLWRYPMLSETFIRREVQALRSAGVNLQVFALEPDAPPTLDRHPALAVHCPAPIPRRNDVVA
jgi:hypothetical protein